MNVALLQGLGRQWTVRVELSPKVDSPCPELEQIRDQSSQDWFSPHFGH